MKTSAYAAAHAKAPLAKTEIDRREPLDHDIEIEILYSGICHSDIHQVRDEWGGSKFPMVPGHEIAGRVTRLGKKVKCWKVGQAAGVGCMVDSCRRCKPCREGLQQFCENSPSWTYNSFEQDGKTPTFGGYSRLIVVDESYVVHIPSTLPLDRAAPLLCAGITTYSPLHHWKIGKGKRVAVVGLGGLGHMGVKIAVGLGAHVTVLSTSKSKEADAKRFGAKGFVITKEPGAMAKAKGQFDFILDTVSAPHDVNAYLELLKTNGTMVLVGVPPESMPLDAFSLIGGRKSLAGSIIGGLPETQEMLNFCARRKVLPDIEIITADQINDAYERMIRGDVKYRFVIDAKTF